jgi:alpha-L-arabinofuranosidase
MNHLNRGKNIKAFLLISMCCALVHPAFAQATLTVYVNKPGHAVSPTLWGIFFEDINLSADGGIYPELVRNRSFEDAARPEYWRLLNVTHGNSGIAIDSSAPLNQLNRCSLRVNVDGAFTLENEGYWGMNIVKGEGYDFRFATRVADGFQGPLVVRLVNSSGAELAKGEISGLSGGWKYHSFDLVASDGDPKAKLQISAAGKGTLFLDMVSLMPKKTWKGHGLRVDLAESIEALHPSFMRFPGGNWVEGDDRAHMYRWKTTVGDIDARTPLWNTWGYNTTQGLGFHEYLQLCEDLGVEPLFCINDGMSLHDSVPMEQMGPWVQDALDAIEYANGPTNTVWSSLRAKAGHPAPFHLRYMEIGNENGGPDYHQRWALLANAVREKYPDVQLIVNTDLRGRPYPRNPKPDIVDEHYYESPESFMWRASQYDSYDRNGPKIFIGEYAVTQNAGKGNLRAAVGEAAFMTGLERNSDIVIMASYAPLFVNLNHRAWNPDLINFDGSSWYGLPGYYVQQMFGENRGDVMLPISVDAPPADPGAQSGAIGVGTWRTQAEFKDIKVTAPDGQILFASDFSANSDGWKLLGGGDWQVIRDALRQNSGNENVRALAGDKSWTDYSLTLKARKLGGNEGFLVLFRMNDDRTKNWWNIGGWGNTANGIELGDNIVTRTPGSIETGRWYDIRVNVRTNHIQGYLDGRLVHDVDYQPLKSLFASATHDSKTGDIILKVVNVANSPVSTDIHLRGAKNLYGLAKAIVLASNSPLDENSLAEPAKVSPKTDTFNFQGDDLHRTFPGNSVTVLRLAGQ